MKHMATYGGDDTLKHAAIGVVGDGVDVRGDFVSLLSLVQFNDFLRVDRQSFVGIHDDAEQTGVRLRNNAQLIKAI